MEEQEPLLTIKKARDVMEIRIYANRIEWDIKKVFGHRTETVYLNQVQGVTVSGKRVTVKLGTLSSRSWWMKRKLADQMGQVINAAMVQSLDAS